jgi:hypothetical protein
MIAIGMLTICHKKIKRFILRLFHQQLMTHMYKVTFDKFAKTNGCIKASQSKFIDVDFVQVNNNQSIKLFENQII